MIDDIVRLPRTFSREKYEASFSSVKPYFIPDCELERICGYSATDDSAVVGLGNEIKIVTGPDAMYRYKFIETTADEINEYFAIADAPIESAAARIYTLWCSHVKKDTLLVTKEYYFKNIAQAFEAFQTSATTLSRMVEDNMSLMHCSDRTLNYLKSLYRWGHLYPVKLDHIEKEIDRMLQVRENIMVFRNVDPYLILDPTDIFRGVLSKDNPKKEIGTRTNEILQKEVVSPRDIRSMLSPKFAAHPYSVRSNVEGRIDRDVDISLQGEGDTNWFDVVKYIEQIPYGVFNLKLSLPFAGTSSLEVFNPYDGCLKKDLDHSEIEHKLQTTISNLAEEIESGYSNQEKLECVINRSWNEDVYITLSSPDGRTTKRLYFDLAYAAIGSRFMFADEDL